MLRTDSAERSETSCSGLIPPNKTHTLIKELFTKDPVKAVEKVLGVDLPDDVVNKIIDAVKAKLTVDDAKELFGALKKLF